MKCRGTNVVFLLSNDEGIGISKYFEILTKTLFYKKKIFHVL